MVQAPRLCSSNERESGQWMGYRENDCRSSDEAARRQGKLNVSHPFNRYCEEKRADLFSLAFTSSALCETLMQ